MRGNGPRELAVGWEDPRTLSLRSQDQEPGGAEVPSLVANWKKFPEAGWNVYHLPSQTRVYMDSGRDTGVYLDTGIT